ncbi:MAG: enoyl-CoA hydratase-related protein [Thermodesulfobacteriota bacterium]
MARKREYVNFDIAESIAVVTVDRPPVNAWNIQVETEMKEIFEELSGRDDFGAAIITGGGEKAFIAGADIKMISGLGPKEAYDLSSGTKVVLRLIEDFDRVVIAAIGGLALGGGCEVAIACDLRVADESALIGLPEVSLGLFPGAGGTQRLPRLVGIGKAKELIFTGNPIPAPEAKEIGLIEKIAPKGQALAEAIKLAKRILERGPVAVRKAKKAINGACGLRVEDGFELETRLFSELFETEDQKEGVSAFLEKRKPRFTGR